MVQNDRLKLNVNEPSNHAILHSFILIQAKMEQIHDLLRCSSGVLDDAVLPNGFWLTCSFALPRQKQRQIADESERTPLSLAAHR